MSIPTRRLLLSFITLGDAFQGGRKSLPQRNATPSGEEEELKRAGERLGEVASEQERSEASQRKKRKLFNGIGKILAGTIAGAGNLMLAAGTIVAPNPATAYGVIASSALAVGGICQGIGDLRGE